MPVRVEESFLDDDEEEGDKKDAAYLRNDVKDLDKPGRIGSLQNRPKDSQDVSQNTKQANRKIQKQKLNTENDIFSNKNNEPKFSISMRLRNVQTGQVKNRTSAYGGNQIKNDS